MPVAFYIFIVSLLLITAVVTLRYFASRKGGSATLSKMRYYFDEGVRVVVWLAITGTRFIRKYYRCLRTTRAKDESKESWWKKAHRAVRGGARHIAVLYSHARAWLRSRAKRKQHAGRPQPMQEKVKVRKVSTYLARIADKGEKEALEKEEVTHNPFPY